MSHGVPAQLYGKSLAVETASCIGVHSFSASHYRVAALKANHWIVGKMSNRKSIRGSTPMQVSGFAFPSPPSVWRAGSVGHLRDSFNMFQHVSASWGTDQSGSSDWGSRICPGCATTDALARRSPNSRIFRPSRDTTQISPWFLKCFTVVDPTKVQWAKWNSDTRIQGTRTSEISASGKQSPAAATKNSTAMGPPRCPHHPPLRETWTMLKATIRLAVSMALTSTKDTMVGDQSTLPGRPKTEPSFLSFPAKLSPVLQQETRMETAMVCRVALSRFRLVMAVTPAKWDTKKLIWTNAEIADSATFGNT